MALRTTWSRRCSGRRRRWRTRGGRSTSRGCERRGARGDGVASRVLGFVIDFLRQGSYASQYLQFHTHTHTRRFSLHSGRPPTDRFSHSPPRRRVVVASRHVLLPHVLLPHRRRGLVAPTSSAAGFVIDFSTRVRMQHKIQPPLRSPADIPIQPLSSSTTRRRRITTRLTSTPPPRSRRTNLLRRRVCY